MENSRLLECLTADFARLRAVTRDNLTAPVPSCPEWTVYDLVDHVAEVYLHKTECMRQGRFPEPWPPPWGDEPVLERLDRAFAALLVEFGTRKPDEPTATWYEPEETVGFWIRRMAQETVIHRVDAELAVGGSVPGAQVSPIPADLAVDGIDEVLVRFLAYGSHRWREDFAPSLPSEPKPPVLVAAGGHAWLVRATPEGALVDAATEHSPAPARVTGDPTEVLLWLWRRDPIESGTPQARISGDEELIDELQDLLHDATQ